MDRFFFIRPFLGLLARGRSFHRALALTLRTLAGLAVLFSLTPFFQAGKLLFELPANGILGGALFEVLFVVAVYALVHVLLIRARDIEVLDGGDYYALRALPVLLRLAGEAYACFVSLVAVGAGVFVWFTGMSQGKVLNAFIAGLLPTLRDNPSFMGGIELMLSGVLVSAAALVLAYVAAELATLPLRLTREGAANNGGRQAAEPPAYRSRFGS